MFDRGAIGLAITMLCAVLGCPGSGSVDAGPDAAAAPLDGGHLDASSRDAAILTDDGGRPDTGSPDAAAPDAGVRDAADIDDAGGMDAATDDGGAVFDGGAGDAGPIGDGGPVGGDGPVLKVDGAGLLLIEAGPALVSDCPGCSDDDNDGLADEWEATVLDMLGPAVHLADDEPLLADVDAVLAGVGRVELVELAPLVVRVYIMLGYSEDYGSCGFTDHHGDSERVALTVEGSDTGVVGDNMAVTAAYTAAHEGTVTDRGRVFEGAALDEELVYGTVDDVVRWVVSSSRSKHATYGSPALCAAAFILPCLAETCAAADAGVIVRPSVVNAGEPDAPLVDDLTSLGFAGDSAWADQPFCGGTQEGGCSSPVREKLLHDPFAAP